MKHTVNLFPIFRVTMEVEADTPAEAIQKAADKVGNLRVQVQVIDAREVFNRLDVKVVPIGGSGEQWLAASSVSGIEPGTRQALNPVGEVARGVAETLQAIRHEFSNGGDR